MMTIGINAMILDEGRLSGIGHYIVQLITHFARLNAERASPDRILVLCRATAARHVVSVEGVDILTVEAKPGRVGRVIAEQLTLPRILRRHGADVLLNPSFTGPIWGAPAIVTTVHDLYFKVLPDLLPRAQRLFLAVMVPLCCRRSRDVIAPSHSTERDLLRYYPDLAGKVRVIHLANRLPTQATLPAPKAGDVAEPFVLLVAALTGNKNPEPLVAAVAGLRLRHPELHLVHVGKDPDQRLEHAIGRFDGHTWIASNSGVSDAALADLYRRCLCVVVPSLYEGFGLPVLEAQALGAPVISSNRGSLPEVGGDGAIYTAPDDIQGIAAAIELLMTEPKRREELRRAGFENQTRFSWEKTARATWNVLRGRRPVPQPADEKA